MSAHASIRFFPKGSQRNPRRKAIGRITVTHDAQGRKLKSKKQAMARAKTIARKYMNNVEQGFYDSTGFHPIRSSRDYDSSRVQHGSEPKRKTKKKARKRKR